MLPKTSNCCYATHNFSFAALAAEMHTAQKISAFPTNNQPVEKSKSEKKIAPVKGIRRHMTKTKSVEASSSATSSIRTSSSTTDVIGSVSTKTNSIDKGDKLILPEKRKLKKTISQAVIDSKWTPKKGKRPRLQRMQRIQQSPAYGRNEECELLTSQLSIDNESETPRLTEENVSDSKRKAV